MNKGFRAYDTGIHDVLAYVNEETGRVFVRGTHEKGAEHVTVEHDDLMRLIRNARQRAGDTK